MATSETVASEFKPKMTHDEFITQLRAAGFTEKTLAALDEEDINSDAALKILSVSAGVFSDWHFGLSRSGVRRSMLKERR